MIFLFSSWENGKKTTTKNCGLFHFIHIFIYSQTVHLQSRKKKLSTCLNTTKTTTRNMNNDHPTWSVCVALFFCTACYSQSRTLFSTSILICKHVLYTTRSTSFIITTYSNLQHVFIHRYKLTWLFFLLHLFNCSMYTQSMRGWRMIIIFISIFYLALASSPSTWSLFPTGEQPAEHTQQLSLDDILLHSLLKAHKILQCMHLIYIYIYKEMG